MFTVKIVFASHNQSLVFIHNLNNPLHFLNRKMMVLDCYLYLECLPILMQYSFRITLITMEFHTAWSILALLISWHLQKQAYRDLQRNLKRCVLDTKDQL